MNEGMVLMGIVCLFQLDFVSGWHPWKWAWKSSQRNPQAQEEIKQVQPPTTTPTPTTAKGLELQRDMKKTWTDGGDDIFRKRFNVMRIKHALTGLQAIASTQQTTANICTPMLLEVPMSLS